MLLYKQVLLALHAMYWTPPILPASVHASVFSEERARHHVKVLTEDIGFRSVSLVIKAGLSLA
jgi:hypothetical protein